MRLTKSYMTTFGLMSVLCSSFVSGSELDRHVVIEDKSSIILKEEVIVSVYVYNTTQKTQSIETMASKTLPFLASSGGEEANLTGKLVAPAKVDSLESGQFIKLSYSLKLPDYLGIDIKLKVIDKGDQSLSIEKTNSNLKEDSVVKNNKYDSKVYQDAFRPYKPMYFLFGVNDGLEDSSFQLSFSYKIFNETGTITSKNNWMSGFHLGYTQKSLWDLDSESKPFEDTSYMPEIFYRFDDRPLSWASNGTMQLQLGLLHESNGQDTDTSRSSNYAYIQPGITLPIYSDYELQLSSKMWAYIGNDDETNPDLSDYKGYIDIEASIATTEGLAINASFRPAEKGTSYEIDASYPLSKMFGKNLDLYAYAKYFNGYSETLLNYSEKEETLRVGFAIVR